MTAQGVPPQVKGVKSLISFEAVGNVLTSLWPYLIIAHADFLQRPVLAQSVEELLKTLIRATPYLVPFQRYASQGGRCADYVCYYSDPFASDGVPSQLDVRDRSVLLQEVGQHLAAIIPDAAILQVQH